MPGGELTSTSAENLWGLFRSIASPSAIFGATAGSTFAVHPVEVSPSIARLGAPKLAAGYADGLYGGAARVSSRIACDCGSGVPPLAAGVEGVVLVGVLTVVFGVTVGTGMCGT